MEELEAFYSVYALYLWAGLAALVVLLGLWVLAMQIRLGRVVGSYRRLMTGVDQGNLEDALDRQIGALESVGAKAEQLSLRLESAEQSLQRAIQRVGFVRFNPFNDTGGDQSFSIALLDARGDGLVFSSLFGRSDTRVFAKPVEQGQSRYALSEEEVQAIRLASEDPDLVKAR